MSGHFTRLVLASDVVSAGVELKRGRAPKDLQLWNAEVLDYTLANHKAERAAHSRSFRPTDDEDDESMKKTSRFQLAATELFKFIVFEDGRDVHHCSSDSCCGGYSLAKCKAKAQRLRREVVVASIPERPEPGKWTKLGSALDWQVLARPNGFLQRIWAGAFGKIEVSYTARAEAEEKKAGNKDDTAGGVTLSWHASASKKCKKTSASLADPVDNFDTIALAVALEMQRFLTRQLLKASRDQTDPTRLPMLLDMGSITRSSIVAALQHLSSLAGGASGRLRMIYGDPAYRSRSWRAWCVEHPDLHVRLRNLIFSISAWVYRRFSHFHRSQGRAYLLEDPKNGADFRQSVLEEMSGLDWCCRGRFWTTLLAKSKSDRINKPLTDPWWHWVLFHVMILISWLSSIADTERDHKLSKDILRESSPMKRPTFSAMHTNTRVARLHEAQKFYLRRLLAFTRQHTEEQDRPGAYRP